MFADSRGKRVIFVAHCVLNQNAKIDRCAHYPGVMREVVQLLADSGVGLVQMPCPELLCLGLDREADPNAPGTIESEDERVGVRMGEPENRAACHRMARELVQQARQYRDHGFEVLGIVGINGSPTCGIEPRPGVFFEALNEELAAAGLHLPQRAICARDPKEAVAIVRQLL